MENKYRYNSQGQLIESSGGGAVYHYTYTPNGNVVDKLVNGTKALRYAYTAGGRVESITDKSSRKTTYEYDKAGRLVTVSDSGKPVATYSYYEDGTLHKIKFANGIQTEYGYNADKNYQHIKTITADGEVLLDYTYAYDGNGNRTQKTGADHVSRHAGNDSAWGTTSYTYDSMQRLQEVRYPTGRIEQFQYDNAGNRALKKYGTIENFQTGTCLEETYQYDNRNLLLERRNPQNVTFYEYDNQGNTVSELTKRFIKPETTKVQNGGTTIITNSMAQTELEQYKTYEYDSFNKTAKVVIEDYQEGRKETHVQRNFYDAENLRYGIEEDGERANFVTNGWSVFTELDAEWKVRKRLIRGYGIAASERLGEEEEHSISGNYHYYHQNEHGDIEYITGSGGKVENTYTYDAFGNITNSEELVKNRYTYNGEQYDNTTSQYYLRARFYNPLIGRFTQEDVYRGDGLNLYAYCGANPVMYVDPSGYAEKPQCKIEKDNDNIHVSEFIPDEINGPNGKKISKEYDALVYGGYYSRKEYNRMRYDAEPGQYEKHIKAKTAEQAKAISEKTPSSPAQYLSDVNNKALEHEALIKGIPVKHSDSTTYFIYDAGKIIGYDRGMPATYIRAELANHKVYHGHPMAQDRVDYYLNKANN